ncbi:hypothetical protein LP7551_02064 [Roseibium album]|nr:hypothetical protein LP7551_02064 [Roseibium album]
MAVRLGKARIAEGEVPFPDGITLIMRTATSLDVEEAEAEAGELIAGLVAGQSALSDFGLDGVTNPVGDDMESALGFSTFLTLALVFERIVSGWDEVLREDGEPAPLDRLYIGLFLLDTAYRGHFRSKAYARLYAEVQEGNA